MSEWRESLGIVLVTHGLLAREFLSVLTHIVGRMEEQIEVICIGHDEDREGCRRAIKEAIDRVDGGRGVILLTDMAGGTPSNLALSLSEAGRVEVIAGLNVPMLIKLVEVRSRYSLVEALEACYESGRKYIQVVSSGGVKRGGMTKKKGTYR